MPTILQNHYVLAVHDLKKSSDFFVNILGFAVVNQPPGWVFVKKDNCMIMMGLCLDDLPPSQTGCHNYFGYLVVDDVDAYYESIQQKNYPTRNPPTDKPWNMREFGIATPEGHHIMIGQEMR